MQINKENITDTELLKILENLEKSHKENNSLMFSIFLYKLNALGYRLEISKDKLQ
jgi:hypothetical protein